MARDLPSGMSGAITAPVVNLAIFCELQWPSGTVRVWSGIGSFTWGGNEFFGVGNLGSISPIAESTDGRSNGITLTLSGIPSGMIATIATEHYQGRTARLWLGCMNADFTALVSTNPYNHFSGKMDVASFEDMGETASITINVESSMIILQQSSGRRYTHEDQQLDYPGDLGLEYVAAINQNRPINWGQPGNSVASRDYGSSRQIL